MYLRLVVPRRNENSHREAGVFMAAYDLLDDEECWEEHRAWLREVLRWFSRNLAVPRFDEPRAVFWFRGGSNPCVPHIWELHTALREAGEQPRLLKTERPGRLVYADEHQVAAVPCRHATFR